AGHKMVGVRMRVENPVHGQTALTNMLEDFIRGMRAGAGAFWVKIPNWIDDGFLFRVGIAYHVLDAARIRLVESCNRRRIPAVRWTRTLRDHSFAVEVKRSYFVRGAMLTQRLSLDRLLEESSSSPATPLKRSRAFLSGLAQSKGFQILDGPADVPQNLPSETPGCRHL